METGNWLGAGQVHFTGAYTGNSIADLELGMAATFRQNNGLDRNFQESSYSAFFQDDWKVLPRLTLDLGVRWELNPPYTSAGNELAGFEFGVQSKIYPTAPLGMLFPGDPGVPAGIAPTICYQFRAALRLCLGPFRQRQDGHPRRLRRFLRGRHGEPGLQSAEPAVHRGHHHRRDQESGRSLGVRWRQPVSLHVEPKNPIFVTPVSQNYVGEHSGTPYVQQYNFMVQQQIGHTMSLQVGFVGNTGRKLYILRDANAPIYGPDRDHYQRQRPPALSAEHLRRDLRIRDRGELELQLAAGQVHPPLLPQFLGDGELCLVEGAWTSRTMRPPASPASRSPTRTISGAITARPVSIIRKSSTCPGFTSLRKWVGSAGSERSAERLAIERHHQRPQRPLDERAVGDRLAISIRFPTTGRTLWAIPIFSGSRTRAQQIAEFFNTAAFAKVPAGVPYGNAGRDVLLGPNAVTWNAAAMKDFPLTESMSLQFRTDFFNLFNEVNFSDPNVTLTIRQLRQNHRGCRGQDAAVRAEAVLLTFTAHRPLQQLAPNQAAADESFPGLRNRCLVRQPTKHAMPDL